jgi:hypothetical protein
MAAPTSIEAVKTISDAVESCRMAISFSASKMDLHGWRVPRSSRSQDGRGHLTSRPVAKLQHSKK